MIRIRQFLIKKYGSQTNIGIGYTKYGRIIQKLELGRRGVLITMSKFQRSMPTAPTVLVIQNYLESKLSGVKIVRHQNKPCKLFVQFMGCLHLKY